MSSALSGRVAAALVSVIIPTYNRDKLLMATLQSVLAQTYPNIEIIVVDDGSTDGTIEMLQRFQAEIGESKMRFSSVQHGGCANARNVGLKLARGQFIQHLDSDDLLLPGKIDAQVRFLEENPNVGVVYCFSETIDAAEPPRTLGWNAYTPKDIFDFMLRPCVSILDPLVLLWRRNEQRAVGDYDVNLSRWVDWEYMVRYLGFHGNIGCVPRVLARYRVHDGRVTSRVQTDRGARHAESALRALRSAYSTLGSKPKRRYLPALSERIWMALREFGNTTQRTDCVQLLRSLREEQGDDALSLFVRWSMTREATLSSNRCRLLYRLYAFRSLAARIRFLSFSARLSARMCERPSL